jgi:hypothetical protein
VAHYLCVKRAVATDAIHQLRASGVIRWAGKDPATPLYVPGNWTRDPMLDREAAR